MLLGIWRNVEDLEDALSLPELETILTAARKEKESERKFMAAIQGIDLEKGNADDAKERFESIKRRVAARKSGKSEEQLALEGMGIDVITG